MAQHIRVLFVDDSHEDVLLILDHLRRSDFVVSHEQVDCAEALAAALGSAEWDLILCDYSMPGFGPWQGLRLVADHGLDLPFIVISGRVDEERLVELMRAGAHDVVLKDKLSRLGPAILREIADAAARRERRQVEGALRDSEKLLKAVVDNAPAEVVLKNVDGRYELINRQVARRYGVSDEEAIGGTVHDVYPTHLADQSAAEDRKVVATGEPLISEEQFAGPDGAGTNLVVRFPIKDDAGTVVKIGVFAMDITERKQAERALRDSERRFSSLVGNIAGAIYRGANDEHWTMAYMSDAIEAISGYPAADFVGNQARSYASIIHPDDRAFVARAVADGLERKDAFTVRYRIHDAAGEVRWIWERGIGVFDDDGELLHLDGAIFDISDQHQAALALQASESRLMGILENAMEAVISTDAAGRIHLFNRGAETMFGFSANEVIGRSLEVLIPEPFKTAHRHHMDEFVRAVEVGRSPLGDRIVTGLRKDGTEFPAEVAISKQNIDGEVILTAMLHDVSARVAAESQLQQAQKMEAVGQLTGGIAHDFNNLLTIITGNLQLLKRTIQDDERQRRQVRTALQAAERGADLTQRLLAFSRQQILEPEVIEIGHLLDGLRDLLQRTLDETIEIDLKLPKDLWPADVDPSQLESAIINLAVNARDAMPEGGALTIEASNVTAAEEELEERSGDFVMLSVTDTGCGIAPEVLERVLEPFFTTKEVGKGSGLGLSMVFGFVEQSGGTLKIDSEQGRGTTVKLYLPRAADLPASTCKPAGVAETDVSGDEIILVVEDDDGVRETAVALLEDLGYRVLAAEHGPAALTVLRDRRDIDLLFTDIVMPRGMDGIALAQEVRKSLPNLKVLFTTGYNEIASFAQQAARDETAWIAKPYRDNELANKVRRVLDQVH